MDKKNEFDYGYIPSPKDIRDYRIYGAGTKLELPESFKISHSKIKNQKNVGSCVAHGISEILETNDGINYSTGWIYGYRPKEYHQGSGMVPSEALKTVNKVGYIPNEKLDINVEMDEAKRIVDSNLEEYKKEASHKQIKSYARLYGEKEIKEALYNLKIPVAICFGVGESGLKLDKEFVAYIPERYSGGHLTVCYGWNEKGFLIQNSWGESWGNKGTFILPYEYPIRESWLISFYTSEEENLRIRKPYLYLIRKIIMKIINFFRKK